MTATHAEPLAERLGWVAEGTGRLLAVIDSLDPAALTAPSLLPGWDRATVLAHLARNADALRNLVRWAATGVETPMYPDPDRRQADIERSAAQPADELVADVASSATRLADAMAALAMSAWQVPVRTATGRRVPAAEIPWLRVREVWIHLVDLDAGVRFSHLPDRLVDALLSEVAVAMGAKDDCPPLRLEPTDRHGAWAVGTEEGTLVTGTAADLLGWLLGRGAGGVTVAGEQELSLPAWL